MSINSTSGALYTTINSKIQHVFTGSPAETPAFNLYPVLNGNNSSSAPGPQAEGNVVVEIGPLFSTLPTAQSTPTLNDSENKTPSSIRRDSASFHRPLFSQENDFGMNPTTPIEITSNNTIILNKIEKEKIVDVLTQKLHRISSSNFQEMAVIVAGAAICVGIVFSLIYILPLILPFTLAPVLLLLFIVAITTFSSAVLTTLMHYKVLKKYNSFAEEFNKNKLIFSKSFPSDIQLQEEIKNFPTLQIVPTYQCLKFYINFIKIYGNLKVCEAWVLINKIKTHIAEEN